MTATPTAPGEVEQCFDYELEEHAGDGEECVKGDGPATHVYRHPGCLAYICTNHAKQVLANKARARDNDYCAVCGLDPFPWVALTVEPLL